jgi:hypothetical protein
VLGREKRRVGVRPAGVTSGALAGGGSVITGWTGVDGKGMDTCLLWQDVSTDPNALASNSAPWDRANAEPNVKCRFRTSSGEADDRFEINVVFRNLPN